MKLYKCLPSPLVLFYLLILFSIPSVAQVGINTVNPKASLDVESDDSGILIPRVALSATNISAPIVAPDISELIYNTATAGTSPNNVSPGFYYWNGSLWVGLSAGSLPGGDDKWDLSGNGGTTPGANFVGTTDDKALHFKTNNFSRLIIPNAYQIHANSRGTAALPFYSFADDPDTGLYSAAANFLGLATNGERRMLIGNDRIISYQIHRFADGTAAAPGITFSNRTNLGFFKNSNNTIGVSTAGSERMRIADNGVGIGLNDVNPTEKLQVNGNIRFDGALKPNNIAGSQGQVLLSEGDGQAPTWGAEISTISRVYHASTDPININYNTYGIITLSDLPAGHSNQASATISVRSNGTTNAPYDIKIHSVVITPNVIEFGYSNSNPFDSPTNYQNVTFNVTLIQ